jgi:pimeloyl-ACP methyl ester carboxylesterase
MKHPTYLLLLCCLSLALASTTHANEKTETHYPLVMIHGFLASGDTYEQQALRFAANGFDMDRIFTFDWNTVGRQGNMSALIEMVDAVLEKTGADKIFLAGHSAGTGLSYSFMADSNRAQLVEAYVHLAGRPMEELPGVASHRVRTLNIYSDGDYIVKGNDIPGAENLRLSAHDHYEVATSEETFAAMFAFFTGEKPQRLTVPHAENEHVQLSGKVLSLGENQIQAGAKLAVYALRTNSGERQQETPAAEFTVDDHGHWGPFTAKKGVAYEFVVSPKEEGSRSIHYYRTPFYTDNPFIYLRTLPGAGSMAGMLLSGIPSDDAQSVVAIFASQQAIIHGRDRLSINETELSTEAWAKPSSSNIAWFLYDANNNRESDFTAIPTFAMMPFLMGVDIFFPTKPVATQTATFNDQHLYFINRKSETEGIVVLVL